MIRSRADMLLSQIVTGILAIFLIGGTVAGWLFYGREIPNWLAGFDGLIVTAAFANGGFFALARTAEPTAQALRESMAMHHQLAADTVAQLTATMTSPGAMTVSGLSDGGTT